MLIERQALWNYVFGGQEEYQAYQKVNQIINHQNYRLPLQYYSLEIHHKLDYDKKIISLIQSLNPKPQLIKYFALHYPFIALSLMQTMLLGKSSGVCQQIEGILQRKNNQFIIGSKGPVIFSQLADYLQVKVEHNSKLYYVVIQTSKCKTFNPGKSFRQHLVCTHLQHRIEQRDLKPYKQNEVYKKEMAHLAMLVLLRAISIAIRYTGMRKQFQTYPNNKQQRIIQQYQAVRFRLTKGICTVLSISSHIRSNLSCPMTIFRLICPYIMQIRQCCGGFGYMRVSGFPQLLQLSFYLGSIKGEQLTLQRLQQQRYMRKVNMFGYNNHGKQILVNNSVQDWEDISFYFRVYLTAYITRLEDWKRGNKLNAIRVSFFNHIFINSFYAYCVFNQELFTYPIVRQILKFHLIEEIEKNMDYLQMPLFTQNRQQVTARLAAEKRKIKINLKNWDILTNQIGIILGKPDEQQFYNEVLSYSKNQNHRNDAQTKQAIAKMLRTFFNEQQAKL